MLANLWFYLRPRGWLKMLTKSVAGGNVVLLPSRWFFIRDLLKMVRVGTYLTQRFVRVSGKMLCSRIAPQKTPLCRNVRGEKDMIKVGVIGYGYWGPNLVRNFATSGKTTLAMVCDLHSKRLAQAQLNYPGVKVTTDYREVIADPGIDAIAVATPVSTHFPLVMAALQAGKHVLVEKPLTSSAEEGRRLLEEVEKRQLVLLVGPSFTYTGGEGICSWFLLTAPV